MARMPFKLPLDVPVRELAAGEKQKLEIVKQLYLGRNFLVLDEPTSVLTPGEAQDVLGLVRAMTKSGDLTVLMISHKFHEVTAFANDVSVLRKGRHAGSGKVSDLDHKAMASMMIGDQQITALDSRSMRQPEAPVVLAGQRQRHAGEISVKGAAYGASRAESRRLNVRFIPEEPLRNACAPRMSVAENLSFRTFDIGESGKPVSWISAAAMKVYAQRLVAQFKVKTASLASPISALSGGNVQRAVLSRELTGDVDLLIVSNPCFGLDFSAVAEIRARIMKARNTGAAVLLLSEDLDELLELSDRIFVISDGALVYETLIADADVQTIGQHMAGHH